MQNKSGVKLWQCNYYEHIIRNIDELNHIWEYILNNPRKWDMDRENPRQDYKPESFGMTHDLKPYPEYKDSGVEWLGRIPAHWGYLPHRALFKEIKDQGHVDEQLLSVTISQGIIRQADLLAESSKKDSSNLDKSKYKLVVPGDIAYNKMRAWQGAVGVSRYRGIVSPAYIVVRLLTSHNPNYFHFLFRTPAFATEAERWSYGITSDQWSLRPEYFKMIYSCVPPRPEQDAIVAFLRQLDGMARRFIRNRQRLIEMLNEQKQAIINRAVTRGLDPNVKLKPSGVEWLGDIPEHWEVVPLKRIAWFRSGSGFPVTEQGRAGLDLPFFRVSDMTKIGNEIMMEIESSTITHKKANELGATVFPADTIIFPKVGGALLTNKRRILVKPSCIDNNMMGCVVTGAERDFVFLLLRIIDLGQMCKPGPVPAIGEGEVREIRVPLPPRVEQRQLVEYEQEESASVDALIANTQHEIDLIREYRTRLIADVVTGKIDVRGIAIEQKKPAKIIQFRKKKEQAGYKANIHFRRAVFAAEIVARLHKEPTFGHVKFQKLIFLCEKKCGVDIGSTYYRQAAGPYDNRALRSIDSQMKKQKWYASQMVEGRYRYVPLPKAGGHKTYFGRYFSDIEKEFSNIIETFRKLDTERCEIVATLYSAWEDLLKEKGRITDDQIVHEVLTNWHESKKRIPRERWENALEWMRQHGFVPGTMRQSGKTS